MQVLKELFFNHAGAHQSTSAPVEREEKIASSQQQNGTGHIPTLHFGVSREMGSRQYQEDEYTCIDNLSIGKGPAYFGIFDGHGGDLFSSHTSSNLHKTIFESEYPILN